MTARLRLRICKGRTLTIPFVRLTSPMLSGATTNGQTLSIARGAVNKTTGVVFAYRVYRDGSLVATQTILTYDLTAADVGAVISVQEDAYDGVTTLTASSNAVGPVQDVVIIPPPTPFTVDTTLITADSTTDIDGTALRDLFAEMNAKFTAEGLRRGINI